MTKAQKNKPQKMEGQNQQTTKKPTKPKNNGRAKSIDNKKNKIKRDKTRKT